MFELIQSIDTMISHEMTILSNAPCLLAAHLITAITYGGVAWWVLAIVAWRRGDKLILRQVAIALVLGCLEISVMKHFFHRERPTVLTLYEFWKPIHGLFADKYSFPSGHSLLSFAGAWLFFIRLHGWRGWLALLFATLVAFCRVYENVHWTSDVLAGALLGVLTACVALTISHREKEIPATLQEEQASP